MAYDELYDGAVIRPIYRKHFLQSSLRTSSEHKRVMRRARACVDRDAFFLPVVRLLTTREYRDIMVGVRQRGRALQLFLTDYYFGGRSYERAGILSGADVDTIARRYGDGANYSTLRPENIQFWYGPDLIRDEEGQFRVIEDNIGFVGGMGDLEALADAAGALGVSIPASRHPRAFYQAMAESYKRQAILAGGGKTILLSYPRSQTTNHEDDRLARILAAMNVTTVSDLRTLKIRADGLFHRDKRVGFVILNMKIEDIEPNYKTPYRISGFWEAVGKGQIGISYAPGLEFVGDKAFCGIVEKLVEFYLNEICLLPSLPTVNLANRRSLLRVRKEREKWVVKLGRGQSGESVWIGRHLSERVWSKLLSRVELRPGDFIAQKYSEPSHLFGHAVDLRPLAIISPRDERVSPIPWGRAAASKKSKTNISCGGLLAPVAVISFSHRD